MPDSSTAKSPACEDGQRSLTQSSNVPVKPGAPGQLAHDAFARVTDVWNRRTCDRSGESRSTLTRYEPVLPSSGSGCAGGAGLLSIVTLTSAHSPSLRSPTASAPLLVREKS